MSLEEYTLRIEASKLRELDRTRRAVEEAFIHRAMSATQGKRYVITRPEQLYKGKIEEDKILRIEPKLKNADRLERIAKNLEAYHAGGDGG